MKDLKDKTDSVVVVGSRAHLEKEAVATVCLRFNNSVLK